jgi:hypothetical protein
MKVGIKCIVLFYQPTPFYPVLSQSDKKRLQNMLKLAHSNLSPLYIWLGQQDHSLSSPFDKDDILSR